MQIKELEPLPPALWRAEMGARGWAAALLAIRWGMTKRRIDQIMADVDRPRYYDDALRALPVVLK